MAPAKVEGAWGGAVAAARVCLRACFGANLVCRIAVGLLVGVVQDGVETMLNSSGDVIFAAAAEGRTSVQPAAHAEGG